MNLLDRITERRFNVAVVGLGYVGLPLAVEFARKGIKTYGIDVDPGKVDALCSGRNYIQDLKDDVVRDVVEKGLLIPTNDFGTCSDADTVYICVPTPFTPNKEPDISYII